MAFLTVFAGTHRIEHELGPTRLTLGSSPQNDIPVAHPDIAPEELAVEPLPDGDGCELVSLVEGAGMIVRGQAVERCTPMDGDVIELGEVRVVFSVQTLPEEFVLPKPDGSSPEDGPDKRGEEIGVDASAAYRDEPRDTRDDRRSRRRRKKREEEGPIDEKAEDLAGLQRLRHFRARLLKELAKVVVGQEHVIEEMLLALLCNGHCLLVGLPGLAKTLLVQTLSKLFQLSFRRVQFTPDLMPSDIIGTNVIEENVTTGERTFKFMRGPIFAHIVLADEINRCPPKTQAALLEAMQERKVTVSGQSHQLGPPFFVLATQNPIEQEGTYPLPEAQLDRFMFNIIVDYPSLEEEREVYARTTGDTEAVVEPIVSGHQILRLQRVVRRAPVSDYIIDFVTSLVRTTRPADPYATPTVRKYVKWGAGPRAGQYLILGAKARAILHGRLNVKLSDVRSIASSVFRHRIGVNFAAEADGISSTDIIEGLFDSVAREHGKEKSGRH